MAPMSASAPQQRDISALEASNSNNQPRRLTAAPALPPAPIRLRYGAVSVELPGNAPPEQVAHVIAGLAARPDMAVALSSIDRRLAEISGAISNPGKPKARPPSRPAPMAEARIAVGQVLGADDVQNGISWSPRSGKVFHTITDDEGMLCTLVFDRAAALRMAEAYMRAAGFCAPQEVRS